MKFEICFWKTVSGEHFVATADWISKIEITVWSFGKGLLNGLIVEVQIKFENSIKKAVSGVHLVTTADWISKMGLLFGILAKDFWMVKLLKCWSLKIPFSGEQFVSTANWSLKNEMAISNVKNEFAGTIKSSPLPVNKIQIYKLRSKVVSGEHVVVRAFQCLI